MEKKNRAGKLLCILALVLAVLSWGICALALGGKPLLLTQPREAVHTAEGLLEAVGRGSFPEISGFLQGNPDLGPQREPEEAAAKQLWNAFLESFSYEIPGSCYGTDSGVALDVRVSYLDFNSVYENLGENVRSRLDRRIRQARDMTEIYDENNAYRQELVDQVLTQAMEQSLREDGKLLTRELTICLAAENGMWQVVPDGPLLDLICAGTVG